MVCPAAEEDLLHKGPVARGATYQAWVVTARKPAGWGTEGLGALDRLVVFFTTQ